MKIIFNTEKSQTINHQLNICVTNCSHDRNWVVEGELSRVSTRRGVPRIRKQSKCCLNILERSDRIEVASKLLETNSDMVSSEEN